MNTKFLARVFAMIFSVSYFFPSCSEKPAEKKELWSVVINFFSPDISYYPEMKNFPFPDSLQFAPLPSFFVNKDMQPIINDSSIIYYNSYRKNGQMFCCEKDTLEVFTDSIKGKKYLFAIGEYTAVFQSDSNSFAQLRSRKNIEFVSLWGITLNTPYSPENFKDEYEKLGTRLVQLDERFDEVSKQKWKENVSISVETIQFNNSSDRMITAVSRDIKEEEVNSLVTHVRNKFPDLKYEETMQKDSEGNLMKVIRILAEGISMSFTQISATEYSFMMTDYYETIKHIIANAGTGYVFRDDVKIY